MEVRVAIPLRRAQADMSRGQSEWVLIRPDLNGDRLMLTQVQAGRSTSDVFELSIADLAQALKALNTPRSAPSKEPHEVTIEGLPQGDMGADVSE